MDLALTIGIKFAGFIEELRERQVKAWLDSAA
jgi:hypothetical protein